jgi:hypothetical protein
MQFGHGLTHLRKPIPQGEISVRHVSDREDFRGTGMNPPVSNGPKDEQDGKNSPAVRET